MNITPVSSTNFKGYDARPLRGFLMNSNNCNIAKEMADIGKKEGFKIFSPADGLLKNTCKEGLPEYRSNSCGAWTQDMWTIIKNKLLSCKISAKSDSIKNFFNLEYDKIQETKMNAPLIQNLNKQLFDLQNEIRLFDLMNEDEAFMQNIMMQDYRQRKAFVSNLLKNTHIPGGNVYITQNQVLIGQNELKKFKPDEIKSIYETENLTILPQADFHIDLFVRPLDKNRILIADDNMTFETIRYGLFCLKNFIEKLPAEEQEKYKEIFVKMGTACITFKKIMEHNNLPKMEDIEKILKSKEFEVIKVPGRMYNIFQNNEGGQLLKHFCNYINAIAFINKEGDLVYITNHSNVDEKMFGITPDIAEKIGFSFENAFVESISPYIKKDKVYFIKGDDDFVAKEMLTEYMGGIHCACAEVP